MESKETNNVYAALFEVQKELYAEGGFIAKSAFNKAHKNKYIPLPKLLNHIVPLLHKHGLMLLQKNLPSLTEGGANVLTVIKHVATGEFVTSNCTPPPMRQVGYEETDKDEKGQPIKKQIQKITPQSLGGSITYARRYDLESLFAIPTEDDDANKASGYGEKPKPAKKVCPWDYVTKACGIESITEKEVRGILGKKGIKTDEQLRNFTSKAAIAVIKESI